MKNVIRIGNMKLSETQARLLFIAVQVRINTLEDVVAAWEKLPDDAMVNNLERHVMALAKEDLPRLKEVLAILKDDGVDKARQGTIVRIKEISTGEIRFCPYCGTEGTVQPGRGAFIEVGEYDGKQYEEELGAVEQETSCCDARFFSI